LRYSGGRSASAAVSLPVSPPASVDAGSSGRGRISAVRFPTASAAPSANTIQLGRSSPRNTALSIAPTAPLAGPGRGRTRSLDQFAIRKLKQGMPQPDHFCVAGARRRQHQARTGVSQLPPTHCHRRLRAYVPVNPSSDPDCRQTPTGEKCPRVRCTETA